MVTDFPGWKVAKTPKASVVNMKQRVLGTWGGGATALRSLMKDISFQWLTHKNWHTLSQWPPGKDEHKKVNHHLSSFEPAHFQLIISKAWTESLSPTHLPNGPDEVDQGLVIWKLRWFDGLLCWGKLIGTKRVQSRYIKSPALSVLTDRRSEWTHQTAAAFGLTRGFSSASRLKDQC